MTLVPTPTLPDEKPPPMPTERPDWRPGDTRSLVCTPTTAANCADCGPETTVKPCVCNWAPTALACAWNSRLPAICGFAGRM